jgi:tetrahydromethanopterin S-methyltransferase subunit G
MTISEQDRFEMHLELKRLMGDAVAETLMRHLPPSGWGDVARKHDLDALSRRVDALEQRLDKRFDDLESRLNKRIDGLERRLNMAISFGAAVSLALLGMQVQIMLSIAAL